MKKLDVTIIPGSLDLRCAYAVLRAWYRSAAASVPVGENPFLDGARDYIASLPEPEVATEEEMRQCLEEVRTNRLEFGYHESVTMSGIAHAALFSE